MVEETDQEFEQEMLQYVREALQESETHFQSLLMESFDASHRMLMESFDEINNLIRDWSLSWIENFEQKFNLAEAKAEEVAEDMVQNAFSDKLMTEASYTISNRKKMSIITQDKTEVANGTRLN